ncbi:Xaa-Pro dipeptidase [Halomonas dongshanensis]|uniref:Xaa-Pro dipeptidase n=1 Tax=Halomonas dongshanensis TaxID=2890835 RepID=A0ABT2ECT7_9GAMM|nr:Xaa-Pro dipeptidase [Halomonas dongshanensis]MCS2609387.1 Xaa-Pro dipeptidase [Halomonas dongshanensis]
MTDSLLSLQQRHIASLQAYYESLMAHFDIDAIALYSGHASAFFADDHYPAFQAFGHFVHWVPLPHAEHCWLVIAPNTKPTLYLHAPEDFWHLPTQLPDEPWCDAFDIIRISDIAPPAVSPNTALVGDINALPAELRAQLKGIDAPEALYWALDEQRMHKSDYEVACLREANRRALDGHRAAEAAFFGAASELDIQLAYLAASRQRESQVPYQNIIGLNAHAGVLHYQHYDVQAPYQRHSLLVDAGYRFRGYAADLTRTYAGPDAPSVFADLITAVTNIKDTVIDAMAPNVAFLDLHTLMHRYLAEVLVAHGLFHGSAEQALEAGITRAFCPHGLGHSLGIQVHDVAGKRLTDGTPCPSPSQHPALRLTRTLAPGMVITIEPGCYFIPMLLEPLRQRGLPLNWALIEELLPCGGIRIEDNVLITPNGRDNLTA